jgi:hypothetical protein
MKSSSKQIFSRPKGAERKELIKGVNDAIASNNVAVDATMHAYRLAMECGDSLFDSMYHIGMASHVVQADFAILFERYMLASREYEKTLYARILAVTVIEYLDDVNNLLGRDLIHDLEKVGFVDFIPTFKNLNKQLSAFKKSHGRLLRTIRNTAMAHKAKSAEALYSSVYQLDHEPIVLLALQVYKISNTINIVGVDLSNRVSGEYRRLGRWLEKVNESALLSTPGS